MSSCNAEDQPEFIEEGERGGWEGSDVDQDGIDWLVRSHRIPAELVCWIPDNEIEPKIQSGE